MITKMVCHWMKEDHQVSYGWIALCNEGLYKLGDSSGGHVVQVEH